jgi:hypothetical protein
MTRHQGNGPLQRPKGIEVKGRKTKCISISSVSLHGVCVNSVQLYPTFTGDLNLTSYLRLRANYRSSELNPCSVVHSRCCFSSRNWSQTDFGRLVDGRSLDDSP